MPQIDFYLLKQASVSACYPIVCRLALKILANNHKLYIHCQDEQQLQTLDDLLWTFNDISFVPHKRSDDNTIDDAPIVLGCNTSAVNASDILLNLAQDIPAFHMQFNRVLEIVPADENAKQQCREHYKIYRDKEYEINTHQL